MKVWEPIIGADSRVILNSTPQLDTAGIEVDLMSGERLLEYRE